MISEPLISIVIANYNYGRFLGASIESLLSQSCQDYELIICDGGSTDNSVEVIKKYADRIAWWCSESDGGQSNAFNKGFSHARGRFLTWLNADDVMLPGIIEKLKAAAAKHPECEWFVGGVLWLDPDMHVINAGRGRRFSEARFRCGVVNGYGPSTFFSKRLFDSVGGVDERFHLLMDTDLWFRFAKAGARYLPFCNYAWGLRLHPESKMGGHNFTSSGKLVLGPVPETEAEIKHQKLVAEEQKMMWGGVTPKKMNFLTRICSASYLQVALAKWDLLRSRNKDYREYFK